MRKFFAIAASMIMLLTFGVKLSAQDAILKKIESAGAAFTTIEASFTQTRTIKASGNTTVSKGDLYFNAPGQLAMLYSQPSGECLIIKMKWMRLSHPFHILWWWILTSTPPIW